eukprot:777249-Amphidinium_carterae.1
MEDCTKPNHKLYKRFHVAAHLACFDVELPLHFGARLRRLWSVLSVFTFVIYRKLLALLILESLDVLAAATATQKQHKFHIQNWWQLKILHPPTHTHKHKRASFPAQWVIPMVPRLQEIPHDAMRLVASHKLPHSAMPPCTIRSCPVQPYPNSMCHYAEANLSSNMYLGLALFT